MPVLRFMVFDRHYACRYDRHMTAQHASLSDSESMQLILGVCHSLRGMLARLAPSNDPDVAFTYRTNKYRLFYYEVGGWRFVLLLNGGGGSCIFGGVTITLENALKTFYSTVFLDWVVKNPLVDPHGNTTFGPGGFQVKLDEFLSLSIF